MIKFTQISLTFINKMENEANNPEHDYFILIMIVHLTYSISRFLNVMDVKWMCDVPNQKNSTKKQLQSKWKINTCMQRRV